MTGGRSHDPVTVATAQGALLANTCPCFRSFDHSIEPGFPARCAGARVELVDETFLVRASSGRAKPLDFIL